MNVARKQKWHMYFAIKHATVVRYWICISYLNTCESFEVYRLLFDIHHHTKLSERKKNVCLLQIWSAKLSIDVGARCNLFQVKYNEIFLISLTSLIFKSYSLTAIKIKHQTSNKSVNSNVVSGIRYNLFELKRPNTQESKNCQKKNCLAYLVEHQCLASACNILE